MKKYLRKIALAFLPALLIMGCTEKEIVQVGISGTLTGTVASYSNNGEIPKQSGTKITVDGSSPEITAVTDEEGKFVINDLKTGTYDLVFTKDGYGTHKIIGYSFVGGEAPSSISSRIHKLSDLKIVDFQLSIQDLSFYPRLRGSVYVDFPDQQENYSGYVRYYLSNSQDVSTSNYIETGVFYVYNGSAEGYFFKEISSNVFLPGTDIFGVTYPCSESSLSYLDINTGNLIYSSISLQGSNVSSVTVPVE